MADFVTCDLLDDNEDKVIYVLPPIIDGQAWRQYGGVSTFGGQAVTVKCFEDNSRVKELLATDGTGKILVVDGGASMRCALMGDMIAKSAVENGWVGVIISGCVRDVDEIAKMTLGVLALASIPKKSVRKGVGETGLPISIGGVTICDGDFVYVDNNGVIVSKEKLV
ncbi:ribonuclease E activity regulator RraA [Moraxella oblonga]|uniref:ribonuclease E activity regulator RraA n=1 Tax=Moraxella oblonga TaxID=200413 RepID=UPI00082F1A7B|nr:ribonuclease E activity regulator RraA [Moraxella oblonga]